MGQSMFKVRDALSFPMFSYQSLQKDRIAQGSVGGTGGVAVCPCPLPVLFPPVSSLCPERVQVPDLPVSFPTRGAQWQQLLVPPESGWQEALARERVKFSLP